MNIMAQDFAYVLGHSMFLDTQDILGLAGNGIYERIETEVVNKIVKKGFTVLDIDAHIGYYTMILAKLVGEEGMRYDSGAKLPSRSYHRDATNRLVSNSQA